MKISTRLLTSTLLILSLLLASAVYVFHTSKTFDALNVEGKKYGKLVLAITDFRAASRQLIVETSLSIYLSNGGKRETLVTAIQKAQEKLAKLETVGIAPEAQAEDQTEALKANLSELVKQLTSSLDLQASGKQREARRSLQNTVETFFKKTYLDKIAAILKTADMSNQSSQDKVNVAAQKLAYIAPLGFLLVFLIAFLVLVPTAVSLKKRVEAILKGLASVDITSNQFPEIEATGRDEFSTITHHFNQMIANLKTSQIQVTKQQADLLNSSRLASLGQMAGGIAHEINNPLHMINGTLRKLIRQIETDETQKSQMIETAKKIESFVNRIAAIIRGLRHISRNGDNDPFTLVPVKQIIDDTLELTLAHLKNGAISLEVVIAEEFSIECRSAQISQVLINLINNALDAIRTSANPWIKVVVEIDGSSAEISVTDSGNGIPEAIAEKLMTPFFTTKEVGRGTGLGLSVSRGIVQSHGGDLILDREAKNTRFRVSIPLKQNQETFDQMKKAA